MHGLNEFISTYEGRANIWTAFNIDYPHHSFKSVGIYYGELGSTLGLGGKRGGEEE